MKKLLYVVNDLENNTGVLGDDVDGLISEISTEETSFDDLEMLYLEVDILDESQEYTIVESLENEFFLKVLAPISYDDMQKVVDLSKRIPDYNEDHLLEALRLLDVKILGQAGDLKIYW